MIILLHVYELAKVKARTLVPATPTNWFLIFQHAFSAWLANLGFPSLRFPPLQYTLAGSRWYSDDCYQSRCLCCNYLYPVNRCFPRPFGHPPVTGHRWNREKRSTRNARIDREWSKTFGYVRFIRFGFPNANPIKCDNVDNMK